MNYNYQVVSRSIFDRGMNEIEGYKGNFRVDTGECLAVTSDKYKIIHHQEVLDTIEDNLDFGPYKRKVYSINGGRRIYAVYDFSDQRRQIQPGDDVGFRLLAKNSYDGSTGVVLGAGLLRQICSNGMVIMSDNTQITRQHSTNIDLGFLEETIKASKQDWIASVEFFKHMSTKLITPREGTEFLDSLVEKPTKVAKTHIEEIKKIWLQPTYDLDRTRSTYNLYNAVTQYLTPLSEDKFELTQRVSKQILTKLV
jgi:hypothetical protein